MCVNAHFLYSFQILAAGKELSLPVPRDRSPSSPRRRASYIWVDRNGRPVSPPSSHSRSPSYKDTGPTYREVMVVIEEDIPLGLVVRGGAEFGLGIYVTGVDESSAADLAGLQIGDQILSINDIDVTNMMHDDTVALLSSNPRMSMVVRNEGKVPRSLHSPYGGNPLSNLNAGNQAGGGGSNSGGGGPTSPGGWYGESSSNHHRELSRKGSPRKRDHKMDDAPGTSESRLDRKARRTLTESQRLSLSYYCNEYETGAMPVGAFVAVLLEQLDTPDKYSLINEIRNLIRGEDLDQFDELIYRREMQAMKSKETMKLAVEIHAEQVDDRVSPPTEVLRGLSPRNTFRTSTRRRSGQPPDVHHLTVPKDPHADLDLRTPSEDSGVDLANGVYHGSRKGSRVSTASRESMVLDTKQVRRKSSPWRTSPRGSPRRSLDAIASSLLFRDNARMRRAGFRRHSSGGEADDKGRRHHRAREDRRWSIGSEMVDAPRTDFHLDAARAVLHRLEAIALNQQQRRTPSPRTPLSPRLSPVPPLSPLTLQVPHSGVRRHRSLPDPQAILERKKQQLFERALHHRSASVRVPSIHTTVNEGGGLFRVTIKKTRPRLGIAIEGGCDTTQPLPRIISIHRSGSAHECGGLQVGHLILEVDGTSLHHRTHREAAQLICWAYYGADGTDHVEFLVQVDASRKKPDIEVRRASIIPPLLFD